jgi:hypothetical protein
MLRSFQYENIDVPVLGSHILNAPKKNYNGLNYAGFGVESTDLSLLGGLRPHNGENNLFYSVLTDVTDGSRPKITTAGRYDYFTLRSMFFGCSINANLVRLPAACTVTAFATTKGGKPVSHTFSFDGGSEMELVEFPKKFEHLKSLSFETHELGGVALTTAIDGLRYTVCE